jgi:ABC-type ATPase involved in cell division
MSILSGILYKKINYDGVTVIVCTHIRERLSKIASVFIRLDQGKIVSVRSHKKKTYKK